MLPLCRLWWQWRVLCMASWSPRLYTEQKHGRFCRSLAVQWAKAEVAPGRLLPVVLGEVLAGWISMALGGYLAARTAKQILDQRIATERFEIEHEPEEERAELSAIYRNKGFSGPLLHRVVDHLTANQERWHRAMVHDELGVVEDTHINPWSEGAQIGLSFVIGGLIPTI